MNKSYCEQLVGALQARNIHFAPGLTNKEVASTEALYGFRFPPDLRMLLQYALPVSEGFVNWREHSEEVIGWRVEDPFLGLLTSVEQGFWVRHWGKRPNDVAAALTRAQEWMQKAPRLIPVYRSRYLPAVPCEVGNPVLSVWCSDIIYYGYNLADYFVREFEARGTEFPPLAHPDTIATTPRPIWFWDAVMAERG